MRKSLLAVGIASAAAMVALGAPASNASSSASNSGHHVSGKVVHNFHAAKTTASKKFKAYDDPTSKYTGKSCNIDLSSLADFTPVDSVSGCKTTVSLSSTFEKRSVPNSWGSWSSPPNSESATPNLLYSVGATTATIDFGTKVKTGGFEYEPDLFQVETVTVEFHKGANGTGAIVGTITRDVDGSSGARLFGATAKKGFKSAVVSNNSGDDFGIAQIRV